MSRAEAEAIPGPSGDDPERERSVSGEHRVEGRTAAVGADLGSWDQLYRRHADFVWRCLMRMGLGPAEAEDALHEVFLVAERRRATYDSALGSHRNWLFGIAANVVRSERRQRRRFTDEGASARERGPSLDGVRAMERESLREALERAIIGLDPDKRAVFCMFELEGLGCAAIANELDVPVGTVYSRLNAARTALKALLSDFKSVERGER